MADEALEHSRETRHLLNNHIQVTGIKLDGLEKKGQERHDTLVTTVEERVASLATLVGKLEGALKWAGSLIVSLVLAVLGWALVQQINANEAQKKDLEQQVKILQDQERARNVSRAEILSRLPPSASEAADAPLGRR